MLSVAAFFHHRSGRKPSSMMSTTFKHTNDAECWTVTNGRLQLKDNAPTFNVDFKTSREFTVSPASTISNSSQPGNILRSYLTLPRSDAKISPKRLAEGQLPRQLPIWLPNDAAKSPSPCKRPAVSLNYNPSMETVVNPHKVNQIPTRKRCLSSSELWRAPSGRSNSICDILNRPSLLSKHRRTETVSNDNVEDLNQDGHPGELDRHDMNSSDKSGPSPNGLIETVSSSPDAIYRQKHRENGYGNDALKPLPPLPPLPPSGPFLKLKAEHYQIFYDNTRPINTMIVSRVKGGSSLPRAFIVGKDPLQAATVEFMPPRATEIIIGGLRRHLFEIEGIKQSAKNCYNTAINRHNAAINAGDLLHTDTTSSYYPDIIDCSTEIDHSTTTASQNQHLKSLRQMTLMANPALDYPHTPLPHPPQQVEQESSCFCYGGIKNGSVSAKNCDCAIHRSDGSDHYHREAVRNPFQTQIGKLFCSAVRMEMDTCALPHNVNQQSGEPDGRDPRDLRKPFPETKYDGTLFRPGIPRNAYGGVSPRERPGTHRPSESPSVYDFIETAIDKSLDHNNASSEHDAVGNIPRNAISMSDVMMVADTEHDDDIKACKSSATRHWVHIKDQKEDEGEDEEGARERYKRTRYNHHDSVDCAQCARVCSPGHHHGPQNLSRSFTSSVTPQPVISRRESQDQIQQPQDLSRSFTPVTPPVRREGRNQSQDSVNGNECRKNDTIQRTMSSSTQHPIFFSSTTVPDSNSFFTKHAKCSATFQDIINNYFAKHIEMKWDAHGMVSNVETGASLAGSKKVMVEEKTDQCIVVLDAKEMSVEPLDLSRTAQIIVS